MKVFENEARVEEYIHAKENWYAQEMENRNDLYGKKLTDSSKPKRRKKDESGRQRAALFE